MDRVNLGLKDVTTAPTRAIAALRAFALIEQLRQTLRTPADWLEASIGDTIVVYALTDIEGRRPPRSTNGIEHDHMAARRRTAVIRVFPNEASFIRLAAALAMERNENGLARRYVVALETIRIRGALLPAAQDWYTPRTE